MKKLLLGGVGVVVCCVFLLKAGFFQDLAKGIKDVGKGIEKGAKAVGGEVEKVAKRTAACAQMTALGTEWAVKQAAFGIAKGGIAAAKLVVDGAEQAAKGLSAVVDGLGKISGNLINLQSATFQASLADAKKLKTPKFTLKGKIVGQPFFIKAQLDAGSIAHVIPREMGKVIKKIF